MFPTFAVCLCFFAGISSNLFCIIMWTMMNLWIWLLVWSFLNFGHLFNFAKPMISCWLVILNRDWSEQRSNGKAVKLVFAERLFACCGSSTASYYEIVTQLLCNHILKLSKMMKWWHMKCQAHRHWLLTSHSMRTVVP